MFHPHLLILAAQVVLHLTLTPLNGRPAHLSASFPDMATCKLAASEIIDAASLEDISFTCIPRYEA